jgi:polyhydroxybutyrate depolymerase
VNANPTDTAAPAQRRLVAWINAGCLLLPIALGCSSCSSKAMKNGDSNPSTGSGGAAAHASGMSGNPANSGSGGRAASAGTGGSAAPGKHIDAGMHAPATDDDGGESHAGKDSGAGGSGARSTGPGDWTAGDYPPDISSTNYLEISGVPGQGDNVRQYKVHVPPGYDPNVPTPVVFCIHGLGQDAVLFCVTGAAMDKKSDQAGFIMIMPNGFENSWNAGTCCGTASSDALDDVALFRAIFAEVGKHVNIDLNRVYATGLSNGAYMSYRLACDAADMITAVAPGAGAVGINDIGGGTNTMSDFTTCEPSQPVSVLDIHGTDDPLIAYALQAQSLTHMADKNGCGTSTKPAAAPKSAGDTTCVAYDGCPSGIELIGCTIQAGGHCWFGSPDCGTGGGDIGLAIVGNNSDTMVNTDAVWSFFQSLSR